MRGTGARYQCEAWVICEAGMCEATVSDSALVLPCFIVLLATLNPTVVYLWEYDAH